MKTNKQFISKVKEIIANGGSLTLTNPVTISFQRYIGYNYETEKHEYVPATVDITEVYRTDKTGEVRVSEGFNYWRVSELSQEECAELLKNLPS